MFINEEGFNDIFVKLILKEFCPLFCSEQYDEVITPLTSPPILVPKTKEEQHKALDNLPMQPLIIQK